MYLLSLAYTPKKALIKNIPIATNIKIYREKKKILLSELTEYRRHDVF